MDASGRECNGNEVSTKIGKTVEGGLFKNLLHIARLKTIYVAKSFMLCWRTFVMGRNRADGEGSS